VACPDDRCFILEAALVWSMRKMKKNTVKDRIFILTATAAFVFLMCLTGYFKMEKSKPFSYKDNLKKEAAVINGKGLTLKDMAFYVAYVENKVEKEAYVYNKESTRDFWNARLQGKIMAAMAKKTVYSMAVHDTVFYREAKKRQISLSPDEAKYAENSFTDFKEDLLDIQRKRMPVSMNEIENEILKMALAQKYQRILAKEKNLSYESLNWDGDEYEKILSEHKVRKNDRIWDRVNVGEITVHHDHVNFVNGKNPGDRSYVKWIEHMDIKDIFSKS
jgi:hypothetical protein